MPSSRPWDASAWTASDDRVRGGSSTSFMTVDSPERACFHGHLDTTTLGGAGFASQRTVGVLALDLSAYAGLVLALGGDAAGYRYTLTLKDEIPGDRGDGRDQAGISWEADFEAPQEGGDVLLPWDKFRATYRGRDKEDAKPLDLTSIKRVSFMMRSFFGQQDGDFELVIHAIVAKKLFPDGDDSDDDDDNDLRKPADEAVRREETPRARSWWRMLFCGLV
ncbi:complex I intermediate-associated protein 30-domain-containing protein [Dactylonectria estremocensis]|uniref:Complex I intermediate-associated protein 30-domain-containing protein n=1 Tax=Dactylonectria estremocensis TaxID=1079267 RepID=A0A9P9F3W9_9HYPO|nr:complex I intermediate-associated protein 30-domain-containing protein [Dactylonectria estremocensis]